MDMDGIKFIYCTNRIIKHNYVKYPFFKLITTKIYTIWPYYIKNILKMLL